ncbi:aminodeoxychorismate synthase component I [Pseudomonas baltica]|uniref:aminodeoxychorismate synthase component I n=1 Tax=Pseudomonas baltica TaxID=2762576 RepID=UPI0028A2D240|nr:aminodeoxychorismate synthase component I [Pseudomonas baltica]
MPLCHLHSLTYHADATLWFEAIRHAPGAVLLDSARPGAERGRFDLLSAWPLQQLQPAAEEAGVAFIQRLRASLAALGTARLPEGLNLPFAGGLIGYLSYDFGRRLENIAGNSVDDLQLPDAQLGVYGWALISDHRLRTSQLVFHPALAEQERTRLTELFAAHADLAGRARPHMSNPFKLGHAMTGDWTPDQYRRAFERIQAYIQAGDCYQINLTQRFRAPCQGDAWSAYRALRAACPTPFSAFMPLADGSTLLSLSPERFIQARDGQVEARPIKGTRPRGTTPAQDAANGAELLASAKDRAENLMIVDLLRNDLGRTCRIGSVKVPELFALESYPNVHHMVSSVTGMLAAGNDALDLIAGSFPGGSITGAPKIRAMQIIDEVEPHHRGFYCGSMLYMDVRGEMDSSIAIRSLLVKDGQVSCWGGGAVVADSNWEDEYTESLTKVQVLLDTLQQL